MSLAPRSCAVIVGGGHGIGQALVREALARKRFDQVVATSRSFDETPATDGEELRVPLDATRQQDYSQLVDLLQHNNLEPRLIITTVGMLHDDSKDLTPEKRLSQLSPHALQRLLLVNTVAPMLAIKSLAPLLPRRGPSLVAALSARVGSIGDNRLGGWYSYRMSKAALNMGVRTAAIEIGRRCPQNICVALHPGTVETALSQPFVGSRDPETLFSPERAAQQLLDVLDGLETEDSGGFFAWDGSPIPW